MTDQATLSPTAPSGATQDGEDAPARPMLGIGRPRQAAVIVHYLLREGLDIPLSGLSPAAQERLSRELAALELVDKTTLEAAIAEFESALEAVALPAPGGVSGTVRALEGRLNADVLARLREEADATGNSDGWEQVLALPVEDLVPIVEAESAEIGSVLISKMPTAQAAELLSRLPGPLARRVAYGISRTADIVPEVVARIGRGLAHNYCGATAPAFHAPPSQRIGAILNVTGSGTRDAVLSALEEEDASFAQNVRKAIFTFEDIPARLDPTDLPKVTRALSAEDLVTALTYAKAQGGRMGEAVTFILDNISKRMAESTTEEMAERGTVPEADGEAAQSALITAIRAAADAGDITLLPPPEG